MLGFHPIGAEAVSAVPIYKYITFDPDTTLNVVVSTQLDQLLADRNAAIDYTADITIRSLGPNGVVSHLYAATREFISQGSDTPANTPFLGTLSKVLRFDRSIVAGDGFGQVTVGWGDLTMINADGGYDDVIRSYAADGRRVVVKVGRRGAAYAGYWTLFDGTVRTWSADNTEMRLVLRDNGYRLEVPAQPLTYGGTGGLDGTTDLKDKRKPQGFGWCENVSPPLVIPNLLAYQPSIGPIAGIEAVYDRGVPLTLAQDYASSALLLNAVIDAGRYATCIAEGLFRLGGAPAGTVTCTFRGDASGGYVNTTGAIVRRLAMNAGVLGINDLVGPSFAALDALQPAEIGIYLETGAEDTVAGVIGKLMTGIGGWAGMRRDGRLEARIFTAPEGAPLASYDSIDIAEDSLSRERLPDGIDPPPFQYRVTWGRNHTVQADVGGQAGVTADRVAFLAEGVRLAASESARAAAIKLDHPLAQDPEPIDAYFRFREDAYAEANRRLDLYGVARALYRFVLLQHPFRHEVGDVIRLTYPRWDLATGKTLCIVSLSDDTDEDHTEVVAFG